MEKFWKVMGCLCVVTVLTCASSLLVFAEQSPGLGMPDTDITIDGKKPSRFSHTVHKELGLDCGECHHDAEHQALTGEKIGELIDGNKLLCMNCHNSDFKNLKLQKRKDVFHAQCRDCHKAGYNDKKGPAKCKACHIAKKQPIS